jgi:hypothetical protein
MTNEQLQDLYDVVYEYTDIMNDDALEILDDVVREFEAASIYDDWLDDEDLPEESAELLASVFIEAAERCEEAC